MVRHQMGISDEHCCADSDVIIFRHLRRLLRYMAPMGYYRWEINPSLRALRTWTGFIPS